MARLRESFLAAAVLAALLATALAEDAPAPAAPPAAPDTRPQVKSQPTVVAGANPRVDLEVDPKSQLLLAPVVLNGVAGRFLLGTGAPGSVVTPEFAGKTGLDRIAITVGVTGGGEARVGRVKSLKVGTTDFTDFDVRIFSLAEIAQHFERPPDGVLGADVLLALPLTLDYASKRLVFGRPADLAGRKELPADLFARHLMLPGTVDGEKVDFVIDTGANISILAKGSFRGKTEQVQGLTLAVPQDARVGDMALGLPRFVLGEQSILGIDFFQRFVVTLDASQKKVYVQAGALAQAGQGPQGGVLPGAKTPAKPTAPPEPPPPLSPALEKQLTDLQGRLSAIQEEEYTLVNRIMATQQKALEVSGITPDDLAESLAGRRSNKAVRDYKALLAGSVEQLRAFDSKYVAIQRQIRAMEGGKSAAKTQAAQLAAQAVSQRKNLHCKMADLCEKGGDYKAAAGIYEAEIRVLTELKRPGEARALKEKLGDAYDKAGEFQKAAATLKSVYDAIPAAERRQNVNLLLRLAFMYEKASDNRKALDIYLEVEKTLRPGETIGGLAAKITSLKGKVAN